MYINRREWDIFNYRVNGMESKWERKWIHFFIEYTRKTNWRDTIRKIEVFWWRIYFYIGESPVGTKRNILKFWSNYVSSAILSWSIKHKGKFCETTTVPLSKSNDFAYHHLILSFWERKFENRSLVSSISFNLSVSNQEWSDSELLTYTKFCLVFRFPFILVHL
jgi:hypothetical protein